MIHNSLKPQAPAPAQPSPPRRLSILMLGITEGIHQFTWQTTRTIQLTTSAFIDLSSNDLKEACCSFSLTLIQSVSFFSLGILGLYDPQLAKQKMETPLLHHNFVTEKCYDPLTAKILCVVNAATFLPCNLILGANRLIATPFRDDMSESLEESKMFFGKAFVDLLALAGGLFSEQLRNYELVNTRTIWS